MQVDGNVYRVHISGVSASYHYSCFPAPISRLIMSYYCLRIIWTLCLITISLSFNVDGNSKICFIMTDSDFCLGIYRFSHGKLDWIRPNEQYSSAWTSSIFSHVLDWPGKYSTTFLQIILLDSTEWCWYQTWCTLFLLYFRWLQ